MLYLPHSYISSWQAAPKFWGDFARSKHRSGDLRAAAQVEDFFTHLLQRVVPKHDMQARAEVTVTRRFLENFSADQVALLPRHR